MVDFLQRTSKHSQALEENILEYIRYHGRILSLVSRLLKTTLNFPSRIGYMPGNVQGTL
jgi:hypothetical protein